MSEMSTGILSSVQNKPCNWTFTFNMRYPTVALWLWLVYCAGAGHPPRFTTDILTEMFHKEFVRFPVAIAVDSASLSEVKELFSKYDMSRIPEEQVVLSVFDKSGPRPSVRINNSLELGRAWQILDKGSKGSQGAGAAVQTVLRLLHEVPFDSAVLLFTGVRPNDEEQGNILTQSLIRRRCRFYVIWTGEPDSEDLLLLKDISEHSGGRIGLIADEGRPEMIIEEEPQEPATTEATTVTRFEDVQTELSATTTEQSEEEEVYSLRHVEPPQSASLVMSNDVMAQLRFPEDQEELTTERRIDVRMTGQNKSAAMVPLSSQQKNSKQALVPLIVEVASGSSLEARTGATNQIQFDVKNNLNLDVAVGYSARADGVIINNVQPPQAYLTPGATSRVQLTVTPLPNLQPGGVGTITLTVNGAGRITSRTATLYFTNSGTTDRTDPTISYRYLGDCSNYDEPNNCENGQWSFEATLRDEHSGLLKIISEPFSLTFRSEFIAGTKSPVIVSYTASCCQPKVDIWAEDLKGNYVRRSLDVFHQGLLAGEIAAIVVGILLLILLIVAIIVAIVLCKRRNRAKLELPRHRAGSR